MIRFKYILDNFHSFRLEHDQLFILADNLTNLSSDEYQYFYKILCDLKIYNDLIVIRSSCSNV